ncbi:hypothetical protein M885DRAFT_537523 [Pelagophyceae sp. CCMP2097]|nr:hypothetical protein M885DRAFT_541759 [Pelagophyceae sp. CCMP2097]KAJ1448887.1 hypothetical protein M885DRAFT_537523 [Pelagophyceae sp. CCMP2097]
MSDEDEVDYVYSDDDEQTDDDAAPADDGHAAKRERAESFAGPTRADKNKHNLSDGVYSLIEMCDVEDIMAHKVSEVSDLLDLPPSYAELLLRHAGWSSERLMEAFVADAAKLANAAGVGLWEREGADGAIKLPCAPAAAVLCRICFCDVTETVRAAPCGHFFCDECYGGYLRTKVDEGAAAALDVRCPEDQCACVVPPQLCGALLDEKRRGRRRAHRVEAFVTASRDLRWCPAPRCGKVARAGPGVSQVRCAPGGCGAVFCMRCGDEAHQPAPCDGMRRWNEKGQNESETANWILANTKRCPKCQTRIEKNQGCNHINCSQCKFEFCWMCMGDWHDHGSTTGGFYKCNKFDPLKPAEDDDDHAKAKRELDRYLHYYKRWHGHGSAQQFAVKQLEATELRMVELQETTQGTWIDVQFLKVANELVIDCRRVLKATYVFGYYLAPAATKQRDLFEGLQEHLERFTEQLSELTEQPIDQMDRSEIVNVTRVTESFLQNLIVGAESGLDVPADEVMLTAD